MNNRLGSKILDGFRPASDSPLNRPAVSLQRPSHFFGLRRMQEQASFLGGHYHLIGTPGIGTTAIASVPVVERRTS